MIYCNENHSHHLSVYCLSRTSLRFEFEQQIVYESFLANYDFLCYWSSNDLSNELENVSFNLAPLLIETFA